MGFEYTVKYSPRLEDEYEFAGLREGASLWCETRDKAGKIALAFHEWAFANNSDLIAETLPVSSTDPKPRGWRVWIIQNEHGPTAYMVDPLIMWTRERIAEASTEPASGWHRTSELYADFIAWAVSKGLNKAYLPTATTFTNRMKAMLTDADFRRRSEGMVVVGVRLKEVGNV